MMKQCLAVFAILMLAAVSAPARSQEQDLTKQGYSGLVLRDLAEGGTVVSWVHPGPLDGRGLSAGAYDLARPDLIVAINGRKLDAEGFTELMERSAQGDPLFIQYRRARQRGGAIPTGEDHEPEIHSITIALEVKARMDRHHWSRRWASHPRESCDRGYLESISLRLSAP